MGSMYTLHITKNNALAGPLRVQGQVLDNPSKHVRTTCLEIRHDGNTCIIYVDSVEDLDDLAFHMTALARNAREAWGETEKKEEKA